MVPLLSTAMLWGAGRVTRVVVQNPEINEQSAVVTSARYPNVLWVLNDSGDKARLFAIRKDGSNIIPTFLEERYRNNLAYPGLTITGADNTDWESLTRIGDTLIIADMGNNGNARRDLGVYFVLEPNPRARTSTRPLFWLTVAFPDQKKFPPKDWRFDCEAVFAYHGKLYFLSKERDQGRIDLPRPTTHLYRLDTRHFHQVNQLKQVDQREDLGGWITAAEMSPDEKILAILAQNPLVATIWLFPAPRFGDHFLRQNPRLLTIKKAGQAEGLCWLSNREILITNEEGQLIRVLLDSP